MKYCNNLSIPQKIVFATFFQIHRNYRTTLRNICSRNPLFHSKLKKMVTLNFPSFSFQNYNIVTPPTLEMRKSMVVAKKSSPYTFEAQEKLECWFKRALREVCIEIWPEILWSVQTPAVVWPLRRTLNLCPHQHLRHYLFRFGDILPHPYFAPTIFSPETFCPTFSLAQLAQAP